MPSLTILDLLRAASELYDAGGADEPIEAIDLASRTLHAPAAVEVAAMNLLAAAEAAGWEDSDALVCAVIDAQATWYEGLGAIVADLVAPAGFEVVGHTWSVERGETPWAAMPPDLRPVVRRQA